MAWYWILVIIAGYLLIGGIIVGVIDYTEGIDEDAAIAFVIVWPISAVVMAVVGIFCLFEFLGHLIVSHCCSFIRRKH